MSAGALSELEIEIPEGVPDVLSTGDVCELLGMSYDQVRSRRQAKRGPRLEGAPGWGAGTNYEYSPQAVAEFAAKIGKPVNWHKVLP